MAHKPMNFDKEYALIQLQDMKKQGYCSIKAMPTWLRNEYRELTLEKAVSVVNDWIKEYKVKHEPLRIVTIDKSDFILTVSEYEDYVFMQRQLKTIRRSAKQ